MDHIAHIKNTGGLDNESVTEETVSEHCKKTALLARSYSAPFNMESTVFVSALLHDLGKCCLPRKTQKVGNHGISRNKAG